MPTPILVFYNAPLKPETLRLAIRAEAAASRVHSNPAWAPVAAFLAVIETHDNAERAALLPAECEDAILNSPALANAISVTEACRAELASLPRPILQQLAADTLAADAEEAARIRRTPNSASLVNRLLAHIDRNNEQLFPAASGLGETAPVTATVAAEVADAFGMRNLPSTTVFELPPETSEGTTDEATLDYVPEETLVDRDGQPIDDATLAAAQANPEGPEADRVLGLPAAGTVLTDVTTWVADAAASQDVAGEKVSPPVSADEVMERDMQDAHASVALQWRTALEEVGTIDELAAPATTEDAAAILAAVLERHNVKAVTKLPDAELRALYLLFFGVASDSDNRRYLEWKVRAATTGTDPRVTLAAGRPARGSATPRTGGETKYITIALKPEEASALDAVVTAMGANSRVAFARAAIEEALKTITLDEDVTDTALLEAAHAALRLFEHV